MDMLQSYSHQGNMYLQAAFMSPITAEQAYKLFDLVPNMESCNYDPNTGKFIFVPTLTFSQVTSILPFFLHFFVI